jgi:hypothetical protein
LRQFAGHLQGHVALQVAMLKSATAPVCPLLLAIPAKQLAEHGHTTLLAAVILHVVLLDGLASR